MGLALLSSNWASSSSSSMTLRERLVFEASSALLDAEAEAVTGATTDLVTLGYGVLFPLLTAAAVVMEPLLCWAWALIDSFIGLGAGVIAATLGGALALAPGPLLKKEVSEDCPFTGTTGLGAIVSQNQFSISQIQIQNLKASTRAPEPALDSNSKVNNTKFVV